MQKTTKKKHHLEIPASKLRYVYKFWLLSELCIANGRAIMHRPMQLT